VVLQDLANVDERTKELANLIATLPFANYCLLRALSAHLIRIVQNSSLNKMTVRNVGIVFSPTLGIPAGVFSLMLSEFPRVFGVEDADASNDGADANDELVAAGAGGMEGEATPRSRDNNGAHSHVHPSKRNSVGYAEASADRLLGLAGRTLASTSQPFSRIICDL
jgi:RalA-binding protein 1